MVYFLKVISGVLLLAIMSLFMLMSCSRSYTYDEYVQFVNNPDNGLVLSKSINGVDYKVTYWPSVLVAWLDAENDTALTDEQWEKLVNHYQQYHYFKVELSGKGQEILNHVLHDKNKYSQLVNNLMFGMNDRIRLIIPSVDTLELVDVHAPRFYGLAPATQLTCIFKNDYKETNSLCFEIDDPGLYTGDNRFEFFVRDIKKIPGLKVFSGNKIVFHNQP